VLASDAALGGGETPSGDETPSGGAT